MKKLVGNYNILNGQLGKVVGMSKEDFKITICINYQDIGK